jgi:HJR/Mrr/RecB family endonuclease
MILLSLLVVAVNYMLWIVASRVIGDWCILGLILTFFGLIPGVVCYVMLDSYLGRRFYGGIQEYERAKKRYDQWFIRTQIAFWDTLTGRQFEFEVANLLNRAGYSATVTPASGDKGVDVLLSDGTIVQCKAHNRPVSPSVARELYGTLRHFGAPRAILISKNGFSKGVYEFARGKKIDLWDVNALIQLQRGIDE